MEQDMADGPTIVLVHGAFADASGFGGIIGELKSLRSPIIAPPNPLRSLEGDGAAIHAVVSAIDGPVVLVGHSYGGAVITQAAATLKNVTALVYLAAFGIDVGESCASVQAPFPPALLAKTYYPTSYNAPGAPGGPDLYIKKDGFKETFCGDSSDEVAGVLFATQRPLAAFAYTQNAIGAGWKTIPSWYLISSRDNAIPPQAQAFMAGRMKATTETTDGSHTAFIANPRAAASFIKKAMG
jgi:pimeloyl-ACP methyl ester carboxylesterase